MNDKRVRARAFRVSPPENGADDMPNLLLTAVDKTKPGDRQRTLDGNVVVRLERCETESNLVHGQFCRLQIDNIPPGAGPSGVQTVDLGSENEGLGHLAAFLYDRETRVLILQHNPQCITTGRLADYLCADGVKSIFKFTPILEEDALEKFEAYPARSVDIEFATTANLEQMENEGIAAAAAVRQARDTYGGLVMSVGISVGRAQKSELHKKALLRDVKRMLSRGDEVRKIRARSKLPDNTDTLDLIEEKLDFSGILTMNDTDMNVNYTRVIAWLKSEFHAIKPEMDRRFKKHRYG